MTSSGKLFLKCCSSWSVVLVGTSRPFRFLCARTQSAMRTSPDPRPGETYPAVNRPIILVPAIVAWQMGMTSCSSASKILGKHVCQHTTFYMRPAGRRGERGAGVPVEILAGAHGHERVGVC